MTETLVDVEKIGAMGHSLGRAAAVSLHLGGAGHFSLTDLALTSPLLVRLLEGEQPAMDSETYLKALNAACLNFFV